MAEPICICGHKAHLHPAIYQTGDRPCQVYGGEQCGCTGYTPKIKKPRDKEREKIRASVRGLVHFLGMSKSYQLLAFLNDLDDEAKLLGGPIAMALDAFQDRMLIIVGAKMRRERGSHE